MNLHPSQSKIVRSNARFKVVVAGRGFGKSELAIEILSFCAATKKAARVLYISPTFQTSRDIVWKRLKKRLHSVSSKINETLLEVTLVNSAVIALRGWESIETLRGQEFDLIVIDEVDTMRHFWEGWEEVLRPTLRMSQGNVVFIGTPKGFKTLYQLSVQCKTTGYEDWEYFHFTAYDNPFLPVQEIEAAKKQLPENTFAQEYLADFRTPEGLVFKEFNRNIHVFTDHPNLPRMGAHLPTYAGLDPGFTHPFALISIKNAPGDIYFVTKEFIRSGYTEADMVDSVLSGGFVGVAPDPEMPTLIEALRRKGVPLRTVHKGPGSVESTIDLLRNLFKQNRLFIHIDCKQLLFEIESYAFDADTKKLPKEGDDGIAALRYIVSTFENHKATAQQFYPQTSYGQSYGAPVLQKAAQFYPKL